MIRTTERINMSAFTRFVLLSLHLTFISATFQIPFRCFIWDSRCLTTLSQAAVPSFANGFSDIGTKPLDPMFTPSLKLDEVGFKGYITNLTTTGYRNSIMKSAIADIAKSFLSFKFHSDLTLRGIYKSKAEDAGTEILMLIKSIDMDMIMPIEIVKNENNSDIMLLKSYEYTYEARDTQCYERDLYLQTYYHPVFFNAIQNWRTSSIPFGRQFMDIYMGNIYTALRTYLLSEPLRNLLEY